MEWPSNKPASQLFEPGNLLSPVRLSRQILQDAFCHRKLLSSFFKQELFLDRRSEISEIEDLADSGSSHAAPARHFSMILGPTVFEQALEAKRQSDQAGTL